MSDLPATESDDLGEEDELPKDLVFLLTPAFDIYRRIEPGEFIAFVSNIDRAIDNQFNNEPVSDGIEIQVACALLPGRKKLVEVQVQPPNAGSAQLERLAVVIDQMSIPDVKEGPVVFFRRCRVLASTDQWNGYRPNQTLHLTRRACRVDVRPRDFTEPVDVVRVIERWQLPLHLLVEWAKEVQLHDHAPFTGLGDKVLETLEIGVVPFGQIELVTAEGVARLRASGPGADQSLLGGRERVLGDPLSELSR